MEEFYRIDPTVLLCSDNNNEQYFSSSAGLLADHRSLNRVDDLYDQFLDQQQPAVAAAASCSSEDHHPQQQIIFGASSSSTPDHNDDHDEIMFDIIKNKITSHPRYPSLVSAYLECQKVGVPPEMALDLDHEVFLEDHQCHTTTTSTTAHRNSYCFTTTTTTNTTDQLIGADPELDQFMELYCIYLQRYKDELSKPLDEATSFMIQIEKQLTALFNDTPSTTTTTSANCPSDETTGSSEGQSCSFDAVEAASLESQKAAATSTNAAVPHAGYGDRALKEMLLHKYSGYLSTLRKEFTKKRKKGKLPRDARMTLLGWWKSHPRWPYPTEEEKMQLVEATGLDQKQITNWFINQRKRHWKPAEDQRMALMDGITSDT